MKIGIIGASGKAGSLILKEALTRGHDVTAIVRDEAKVQVQGVSVLEKDVFDLNAEDIKGFDVVVNAFVFAPGKEHLHVEAGKILIEAMKGAPQTKLIVVGGAGSLSLTRQKRSVYWIRLSSLKNTLQQPIINPRTLAIYKMPLASIGRSSVLPPSLIRKEIEQVGIHWEKTTFL